MQIHLAIRSFYRNFVAMKHLLTLIAILLSLCCCTSQSEHQSMRQQLDSINQRNRNDQPFTAADVEPYVAYFDRHGSANDRLLAHYLLGRAYHEAGEAPLALQCYHEAVDCADTTAADCDFAQLSRVYGQMGELFYQQNLVREQAVTIHAAVKYSLLAGDTLTALFNYEHLIGIYDRLGKADSALLVMDTVTKYYRRYGKMQDIAIAYGRGIPILVDLHKQNEARNLMAIYEEESGWFNTVGDIVYGKEIYYHSKGMLCLYENCLDSAEFWFRKELNNGLDFNNQNAAAIGLATLYTRKHQPDSIAKYAIYAYAMNDSIYAKMATTDIEQIKAMYDYSRNQRLAIQKSEEAKKEKERRQTLVVAFVLFVIICVFLLYKFYQKGKFGLEQYRKNLVELQKLHSERQELSQHALEYERLINRKEKEIETLEKSLSKYGKLIYFNIANAERCLKNSPTYHYIGSKAVKGELLVKDDWDKIELLISEYLPGFEDFLMTNRHKLKVGEYRICLLLRLHFRAVDIAGMTDISKSLISQHCTEIVRKLFNGKGSSKELSAKLAKIF